MEWGDHGPLTMDQMSFATSVGRAHNPPVSCEALAERDARRARNRSNFKIPDPDRETPPPPPGKQHAADLESVLEGQQLGVAANCLFCVASAEYRRSPPSETRLETTAAT